MRRFALVVALAGLCCSVGCNHHRHRPNVPAVNKYLKSFRLDDCRVVFDVSLPEFFYGFLSQKDATTTTSVVIGSGDVDIGNLEVGEYDFCLELFRSPDETNLFVPKLEGVVECLHIVVDCTLPPPPPCPDPDPTPTPPPCPTPDPTPDPTPQPVNPTLCCNLNDDGGVAIVITLNDFSSVVLHRTDTTECDRIITENTTIANLPLPPGTYTFQLLVDGNVLASCSIEVPNKGDGDDCDDNDDDDSDAPPGCPPPPHNHHTRFVVCHNGHTITINYHALKAHLQHGDKMGPCGCKPNKKDHDDDKHDDK